MPGEWIKMRMELHDSPKVGKIARLTGLDRFAVVGRLHRVWGWVDQTSEDGQGVEGEPADLDDLTACAGFGDAMAQVGWLQALDGHLHFQNFSEHNGRTAKRRAEEARRKYESRKPCPQNVRKVADTVRTDCAGFAPIEPEQEQEPERKTKTKPADAGVCELTAAAFDAFWREYPSRPGQPRGNKKQAWAAWQKLSPEDRAKAETAAARLVETVKATGRHPPDAQRFLGYRTEPGWPDWYEDTGGAVVSGDRAKLTVAEQKDAMNHQEDGRWLSGT